MADQERIELLLTSKFDSTQLTAAIKEHEKLLGVHTRLAEAFSKPLTVSIQGLGDSRRRIEAFSGEVDKMLAGKPAGSGKVDDAATKAVEVKEKLAKADADVTAAAKKSDAALEGQRKTTKKKAEDTGELKKKVDDLAKSEGKLERASRGAQGVLVRTFKDGDLTTEKRQAGPDATELTKFSKEGETLIRTEKTIAQELQNAKEQAQDYGLAMRKAGNDEAAKLDVTKRHIDALKAQSDRLAKAGYQGSSELRQIQSIMALRKRDEQAINNRIAAIEKETQSAQDSLQKQVTGQEHLAAARRKAQGAQFRNADKGRNPLTAAADLEAVGKQLLKQARTMKAEGAAEADVSRVRLQGIKAITDARRVGTAEIQRQRKEQERADQAALEAGEKLTTQLAHEQRKSDVARVKGAFGQRLADQTISEDRRAKLLEAQAVALARQAAQMRVLGMSQRDILQTEQMALASANAALGIRTRLAKEAKAKADQDAKSRALVGGYSLSGFESQGTTRKFDAKGSSVETERLQRVAGKLQENVTVTRQYDEAGRMLNARITETNKTLRDLGRTGDWSARSFLHNTVVVTAWAASVATLYGTLNLLKAGIGSAIALEARTAVLKTVFRGTSDEAYRLRDEVMKLAVAEGRSSDEAIDAATRFSRLGLSRVQVQQAVAVSLRAANVAEISAAEAAENLAAIMASFNLQAKDLTSVLNQLNAISNTYNVTNKDLLNGIARVGALAAQAKLPLSDLMGLIATGVGTTGRPGAEFGNAIKALIVSISTPSIQKNLREAFDFDVLTPANEIKEMDQILGELYVRYVEVTNAEKQHLTQMLGQKQQASRLSALLDGYVDSQKLAIRALRDQNSAERENMNIRATMISQLRSLQSEFQRASTNLVASTDSTAMTNIIQNTVKGLTGALHVIAEYPSVSAATGAAMALMVVHITRTALAMHAAGTKGNFFTNTLKQVAMVGRSMSAAITQTNATLMRTSVVARYAGLALRGIVRATDGIPIIGMMGKAVAGVGRAAMFAVGALRSMWGFIKGFAVMQGVFLIIGKLMSGSAAATEQATAEMAGYNAEIERASQNAEALQKAGSLFENISKTIRRRSPKQQLDDVRSAAEVAEPDDEGRRVALEKELKLLIERGRFAEFAQRMEQLSVASRRKSTEEAQHANDLLGSQLQKERKIVDELTAAIELRKRNGQAADMEREKLRQTQDRIREFSDSRNRNRAIIDEDIPSEQLNRFEKLVDAKLRGRAAGMERFAQEVPKLGAADELDRELALMKSKLSVEESNLRVMEKMAKARLEAQRAAAEAARTDLEQSRNPALDQQKRDIDSQRADAEEKAKVLKRLKDLIREDAAIRAGVPKDQVANWKPSNFQAFVGGTKLLFDGLDAAVGEPIGEGGRRMKEISDTMKALGIQGFDAFKQASDDIKAGATNSVAAVEAFNKQNAAYLELVSTKEKAVELTAKEAEVTDAAANAERVKSKEAITQMQQEVREMELRNRRAYEAADIAIKAKRDAEAARTPSLTGLTDSEQMIRQSREIMGRLIPESEAAMQGAAVRGDQLGIIKEQVAIRDHLLALQSNENALIMRGAELEREKTNERIRQTAEVSKQLLMASREEQLQAAYLARYVQNKGKFSVDDFQFLSQRTRQNIEKFTPDAAPDALNTSLQVLRRESDILARDFTILRGQIQRTIETFKGFSPEARTADYVNGADAGRNTPVVPNVAVNVNGVSVQFAEQFREIAGAAMAAQVQAVVTSQVQPQIDRLIAEVRSMPRVPMSNVAPN